MDINTRAAWLLTWAVFATLALPDVVQLVKYVADVVAVCAIVGALVLGVMTLTVIGK